MKQTVILKSNNSGITLVLDKEVSFEQLVLDVIEVFRENDDFFQNSRFAIAFKGRQLTEDEEIQLVMAINQNTNANVLRIVSDDEEIEEVFKHQLYKFDRMISTNMGKFHKGTLNAKDVLESDGSIVILGDVQAGARVTSKGNIIVLGALRGNAHAGAGGNEEAFVAALLMEPSKLKISDLSYNDTEKKSIFKRKSVKTRQPQMASIKGGRIELSPIITE